VGEGFGQWRKGKEKEKASRYKMKKVTRSCYSDWRIQCHQERKNAVSGQWFRSAVDNRQREQPNKWSKREKWSKGRSTTTLTGTGSS